MTTDPIELSAQARAVIQTLHQRNDVVVRLKTDKSGFAEDARTELDKAAPGHFQADKRVLTLDLDTLITKGKPLPESLETVEDFRKYPVLAGVAAHESAHARYSLWDTDENPLPESIPNPEFDPEATEDEDAEDFDRMKLI